MRSLLLVIAAGLVANCQPVPAKETWAAVVEWQSGSAHIVDRGTLPDCMASLARFDSVESVDVAYCERESVQ